MTPPYTPTLYRCLRCLGSWGSRSAVKPKHCAKCNSPYWDRPRKGKSAAGANEHLTGKG